MEINVLIEDGFEGYLAADRLEKLAQQVLAAENADARAEAGIVITGEEKIRELHRVYLEEDTVTDVLSFPMMEEMKDTPAFVTAPDEAVHLGEVIICYPQAVRQAEEHGHSALKEVAVLMIHGLLHLLGYDHDIPEREQVMHQREAAILEIVEESLR
jgi:probable rRNA maturation factor